MEKTCFHFITPAPLHDSESEQLLQACKLHYLSVLLY
jgi:hypothetical protein